MDCRHRSEPLTSEAMSQTNPSRRPIRPKLQIEMQGEEPMSFREAVAILTPGWAKRLFRRRSSS
jgi:hypothetical protein